MSPLSFFRVPSPAPEFAGTVIQYNALLSAAITFDLTASISSHYYLSFMTYTSQLYDYRKVYYLFRESKTDICIGFINEATCDYIDLV